MPLNFDDLPDEFRRIPEDLARLAVGWQMVPANDPVQTQMTVPAHVLQQLQVPGCELILVGSRVEAPESGGEVVAAIVATNGVIVRGARHKEPTALYGNYVLRVGEHGTAVYERGSVREASELAHRGFDIVDPLLPLLERADRRTDARHRREAREAAARYKSARASAGAHHTVLAAMKQALQPLIDSGGQMAAGIARDVLDRQGRITEEMDADVALWDARRKELGSAGE